MAWCVAGLRGGKQVEGFYHKRELKAWKERKVAQSCPTLCAYQALTSMGFSRQEYWSGLPFPSPGDLPDSGIEPRSPALQTDALPSEPPGKHGASIYLDVLRQSQNP